MRKLLLGVKRYVYTDSDFQASCQQLHRMAVQRAAVDRGIAARLGGRSNKQFTNWYVTFCTSATKSGASSARTYRQANDELALNIGGKKLSGTMEEILPNLREERGPAVLVVVDDFIGTGRSAVSGLRERILPLLSRWRADWKSRLMVVYAVTIGFESGVNFIRDEVGDHVIVLCHRILGDEARAFSQHSDLWSTDDERLMARQVPESVGR